MTDSVQIKEWWSNGAVMIRTDALDHDHPMHPYNQVIAQGKVPEEFGIENPAKVEFKNKSRQDLIDEVLKLREEIRLINKYDRYSGR